MTRRSSSFALCTPDRILLQLRDAQAPRYPNHWGFFGGGVEPGETHLEAVIREAREELQLDLASAIASQVHLILGEFKSEHDIVMLYLLPLAHSLPQLRSQQREGAGLGLFTYEEACAPGLLMVPSDRPLIEAWRDVFWGPSL